MIIILPIIFGIIGVIIAGTKGRNQFAWFAWCFLFPLIGLVVLLCMSNLKKRELKETKTCPKCAERVKLGAMVCKHCSYDFSVESKNALESTPQ